MSRSTTPMPCSISNGERALGEAGRGRRAEQIRPLERTVRFRQALQLLFGDVREQRQCSVEMSGGDAGAASRTPVEKNASNTPCSSWPRSSGVSPDSSSRSSSRRSTLRGEILEWTREISFDPAHRITPAARARWRRDTAHERPASATAPAEPVSHAATPSTSRRDGAGRATALRARRCARGRRLGPLDFEAAAGTSSRNGDGGTIASSSSVNDETDTRRAGRNSRSSNRARAAASRSASAGHPSSLNNDADRRCCGRPLRPVRFDQPDEPHRVELSRRRCRGVEQQHAAAARPRRERLPFDPSPHRRPELGCRQRPIVVPGVRVAQRDERADDGRPRAHLALSGSDAAGG